MSAINPGSDPVENASEAEAAANMVAFAEAVGEDLEPVRAPELDVGGRFGWRLGPVEVLMPGVPLVAVRDDARPTAPCLKVNGSWWWWADAVGQAKP